jgi:hypothetical protein
MHCKEQVRKNKRQLTREIGGSEGVEEEEDKQIKE